MMSSSGLLAWGIEGVTSELWLWRYLILLSGLEGGSCFVPDMWCCKVG